MPHPLCDQFNVPRKFSPRNAPFQPIRESFLPRKFQFRAKRGLYSGSRVVSYGFWAYLIYSLWRLRPRRHVLLGQKLWPPSRWSCKAYKLYGSAGLCLPGKSMFARSKTIAHSWPKVVHPIADAVMVKMLLPMACQLAYSWLHSSKTDDIMELLSLLMLQHI